jgi:hypothetical protein
LIARRVRVDARLASLWISGGAVTLNKNAVVVSFPGACPREKEIPSVSIDAETYC